jgi:hypothetical protein
MVLDFTSIPIRWIRPGVRVAMAAKVFDRPGIDPEYFNMAQSSVHVGGSTLIEHYPANLVCCSSRARCFYYSMDCTLSSYTRRTPNGVPTGQPDPASLLSLLPIPRDLKKTRTSCVARG